MDFKLDIMKTAVEWLVEQILQKVRNYEDGDVETEEEPFVIEYVNKYNFNIDLTKFINQAKEMEKEQMKDSYKQGFAYRDTWNWELDVDWDEDSTEENNQEFEQYYNETFKSE
jgi:hypothetical protein